MSCSFPTPSASHRAAVAHTSLRNSKLQGARNKQHAREILALAITHTKTNGKKGANKNLLNALM